MRLSTAPAIIDRLDADWNSVTAGGRARRSLRAWRGDPFHGDVFAGYARLDDIIDVLHASTHDDSDPILFALIGFAQASDEIAARLVLQSFAGLALSLSAGTRFRDLEYQSDVFGVLAEMIATFPLDTHPTHVAGHMAFMVRRQLNRTHRRRHHVMVSLDETVTFGVADGVAAERQHDARTAADRIAEIVTVSRAQGALDDDQARLLMFVAAGHQVAALARHAGCHRSRMGARLTKATIAAGRLAVAA
jgi:hypothetical protein